MMKRNGFIRMAIQIFSTDEDPVEARKQGFKRKRWGKWINAKKLVDFTLYDNENDFVF